MEKFILNNDPEILFGINFGITPSNLQQKKLLDQIIRRFNNSIPNGRDAVDIEAISEEHGGVKGLCAYNTKDWWKHHRRIEEVIDWENSDCLEIESIAKIQNAFQNSITSYTRHQNIFA